MNEIFQPLGRFFRQGPAHLPRQRHALRQRRGALGEHRAAVLAVQHWLRRSAAPGGRLLSLGSRPQGGDGAPRRARREAPAQGQGQIRRPFHSLEHTLCHLPEARKLAPGHGDESHPVPTQTSSFREVALALFPGSEMRGRTPAQKPHHGLRAQGCVGVAP